MVELRPALTASTVSNRFRERALGLINDADATASAMAQRAQEAEAKLAAVSDELERCREQASDLYELAEANAAKAVQESGRAVQWQQRAATQALRS